VREAVIQRLKEIAARHDEVSSPPPAQVGVPA
jgi:hypothetical protein